MLTGRWWLDISHSHELNTVPGDYVPVWRVSLWRASVWRVPVWRVSFDAVPVRRVSVWRDASLARFTLPRFPFLCLNCTEVFSIFAGRYFRVNNRFAKIFSRENISNSLFAKISSRENNVLYSTLPSAMFVLWLCSVVAVGRVGYASGECFLCAYLLCAVHHLFIILVNVSSRLHISGLVAVV